MARPASDIRVAVLGALESGPGTLVDIVLRSNVGYTAARYTVQNALRSGAVQVCGQEKRAHAKRWLAIYELVEAPQAADTGVAEACADLGAAVCGWGRESGVV